MSKKHKRRHQQYQLQPAAQQTSTSSHHSGNLPEVRQEMRDLKNDLWHLLAVNIFLLAALITLYYTNQSSHYLNNWLDKFIHI